MNDSRRLPTTLRATLLLAIAPAVLALASCGSSGGSASSTSTSEARENAQVTTQAAGPVEHVTPSVEQLPTIDDTNPAAENGFPARPYLCSRDPVAFNLSRLNPGGGTPQGFARAWSIAHARSELPGFVIAYSGTVAGPMLKARVGAVRRVTSGIYAFMKTLPGSEVVPIGLEQADPYHVRTRHRGNFITAFGSTRQREGFVVSDIIVEGRLDETCRTLRNVKVTMTLPLQNREQRFGDVLLGTVLGLPDGTDNEGKEAWHIELTGDYLDNMMFSL